MDRKPIALTLALISFVHCTKPAEQSAQPRPPMFCKSMDADDDGPLISPTRAIDWNESAGVFIGIQKFHRDSDLEVAYAADDAVDLAYLFTHELHLLPLQRISVILAGLPAKESSRTSLGVLRREATLIEEDEQFPIHRCVDAETILRIIREQAERVGRNGILIVAISTHGVTVGGQQSLLTANASTRALNGVLLAKVLETITGQHVERMLLLLDACRRKPASGAWAGAPSWVTTPPGTFLEETKIRMPYAVIASTGPDGYAYSDAYIQNGYLTRAVVEGLRCGASAVPDGYVTLSTLATYVSESVRQLSHDFQQPESRIGGLEQLRLVQCANVDQGAVVILSPRPGEVPTPNGSVDFRVRRPELYATVIICAARNNVCYNQNPAASPIATAAGETVHVAVQYGAPDSFTLHVALTADPDFLRGEEEWPYLPRGHPSNRIVYWSDPVKVTLH